MNISTGHVCPKCGAGSLLYGTSYAGVKWLECLGCGFERVYDKDGNLAVPNAHASSAR